MATSAAHFLSLKLAIVAAAGIILVGGKNQALAQQDDCGNLSGLGVLVGCQDFIVKEGPKVSPNALCCNAVKEIGMPCTCKLVTKQIEELLSMEKLAFVAQFCGRPIAPGTKCGSYTAPPVLK
ncbi:uncharacterized protein LOC102607411 [Citrus sinensis]|uniref:uncharacterized protein LOC102607411 n=1 Tax=Citrus sinensis TaxID=2711 RepID=UPI002278B042|nr:uncharacterized protein LOC102607411 [Citrus sinensis]